MASPSNVSSRRMTIFPADIIFPLTSKRIAADSNPNSPSTVPDNPLTTFELFVKFPDEIQLEIWNAHLDNLPGRVVELKACWRLYIEKDGEGYDHVPTVSTTPLPTKILHVNRQARSEALRKFRPIICATQDTPNIYVDTAKDIIFFTGERYEWDGACTLAEEEYFEKNDGYYYDWTIGEQHIKEVFTKLNPAVFQDIVHVAFNWDLWDWTCKEMEGYDSEWEDNEDEYPFGGETLELLYCFEALETCTAVSRKGNAYEKGAPELVSLDPDEEEEEEQIKEQMELDLKLLSERFDFQDPPWKVPKVLVKCLKKDGIDSL